jgi:hypothetical protein
MLNGEHRKNPGYIFTDIKKGKDVPILNYVPKNNDMKIYEYVGVEV